METPAVRKPLPQWSRLLILMVSLMFAGSIYGIVSGAMTFKATFEHSQEAPYIKKVASGIAGFPDPLPAGYEYVFGADLDLFWSTNLRFVGVDYAATEPGTASEAKKRDKDGKEEKDRVEKKVEVKGKQQILFFSCKGKGETDELLDSAYRIGLNTHGFSGKFIKLVSRGSWTFQGATMPYIVGEVEDPKDEKHMGLVACMILPEKEKILLLYAVQLDDEKKFDINVCMNLLKEMSGF
ncbi:hypothetical protein GC174_04050 [bacterium]|nr:hypothetical protein [bacterium]